MQFFYHLDKNGVKSGCLRSMCFRLIYFHSSDRRLLPGPACSVQMCRQLCISFSTVAHSIAPQFSLWDRKHIPCQYLSKNNYHSLPFHPVLLQTQCITDANYCSQRVCLRWTTHHLYCKQLLSTPWPRPALVAGFPSIMSLRADQAHLGMEVFDEEVGDQISSVMDN